MHFAEFGVIVMLFLVGPRAAAREAVGSAQADPRARQPAGRADRRRHRCRSDAVRSRLASGLGRGARARDVLDGDRPAELERAWVAENVGGTSGRSRCCCSRTSRSFRCSRCFPLLAGQPVAIDESAAFAALPGWGKTIAVLGVVGAIVLAGRYLMQPLFRWVAGTGIREIFVAFALLIVVGIALLMERVGLSPALGTFVAGVVLADSEYRHELEMDLEPFKGLLLAVFFIAVGSSIDFALLASMPVVLLGHRDRLHGPQARRALAPRGRVSDAARRRFAFLVLAGAGRRVRVRADCVRRRLPAHRCRGGRACSSRPWRSRWRSRRC